MHQMHKDRQKVEMMLSNFLQRFSPISLQKNFVFFLSAGWEVGKRGFPLQKCSGAFSSYEILYVIIGCILNVLGSISVCVRTKVSLLAKITLYCIISLVGQRGLVDGNRSKTHYFFFSFTEIEIGCIGVMSMKAYGNTLQ